MRKIAITLQQYDLSPQTLARSCMMQKMCEVHDCEKFQLKNARWRTAAILNIEKLQYLRAMQNGFLKRIGCPPSWIFEISF